jgi:flagellar capping protein FliD
MFNGTSRYAQDFANVISRATAIASLPIKLMSNDKDALSTQAGDLSRLNDSFSALQTAIGSVQDALGGASFQAAVSDDSKISASVGDGAVEGVYSIEVIDPGSYASSQTPSAWVNDTATHTYQLSLGGVSHDIHPANNSAAGVAQAINDAYGDQVHAAVVNVGSTDIPDYRISLQATSLGNVAPNILVDGHAMQGTPTTGTLARYIVNGSGNTVTSTTQSVQIQDGLTVTLKQATTAGTAVNITVSRSTSALSDALTKFTSAYNSAVDAVDAQRGMSGGTLAGNPVVSDLSQILSQLATYGGPGQISGLKGLGMELDPNNTGHLTFNSFSLMAADLTTPSAVTSFLGNATSGGFVKSATDLLTRVEDATTGILPMAQADMQSRITGLTTSIADQQSRVDDMTAQMQSQIAAADALIASMEQQYGYLSGMFSAMQTADQQYK